GAVNFGTFESATVSPNIQVDGKSMVTTKQSGNPDALGKMDAHFGSPGATTLHEVVESYIAGQMVQQSEVSSGNSTTEGSIYNAAHTKASTIAPQSGPPFYDFRDANGNPSNTIPAGGSGTIYVNSGQNPNDIL